ncbi:LAMI_0G11298g1_1 [Lachancea mirantina]|uniref:LAMI_0G11298g1_1 n=1 Tax=Lachancea mirantina TaxID=1230905 RepID=A0A1G4KAX6_9SACH|nr:LAMI_0G11298g1_1 [Lachancea mirantina]
MVSRKSIKSSVSSVKSQNKSLNETQGTLQDDQHDSRQSPTSWSIWGARKEGAGRVQQESLHNAEEDSGGWWRKPSISSLRGGLPKKTEALPDRRRTGTPERDIDQDQLLHEGIGETTGLSDNEEPRRRTWSFWRNKNEEAGAGQPIDAINASQPGSSGQLKPIINELITYPDDAILFKTKSKEEIEREQNLKNENEELGFNKNILVPNFDILPPLTTLASLYISVARQGHKWNLLRESTLKQRSLYKRPASVTLDALCRSAKPPKVLIIGVHGFFPHKMIRPLIGEPTGTSTKFITEAEKAVIRWFKENDTPVEIGKIALEREGKVSDRVAFFFEVLKKWSTQLNDADFVYFVAHSQGCPVTLILLAQLIESGLINPEALDLGDNEFRVKAKPTDKVISVLAMAGVNNGPFYGVDQTLFVRAYSTIENDSLRELFQFQNFDSTLAKKLIQSLRLVIASNVKITFVGSINDQLVPLYSSTCLFAHHPNIFRATFIDKDSRTPAFITKIVETANSLNNLGYDDHGIIKEISSSLAGTLTGGGHSKIYNEGQVYELGIKFAMETTNMAQDTPVSYRTYEVDQLGSNPYHLPWCMRGLLFETSTHLGHSHIDELFKAFEDWEPDTKQLKDVKYRLNGLRSRL